MSNNRYYAGNYTERTYQNPVRKYEYQKKEIKSNKYGIPKPNRQIEIINTNEGNFAKTMELQRRDFIIKTNPNQNDFPTDSNMKEIKKINNINQNNLIQSYQQPLTDRYNYNNEVLVYQRKISKENNFNFNNNSFIVVKHNVNNNNNNNINNQVYERKNNHDNNDVQIYEKQPLDNYKNKNIGFKAIRDRTPNLGQRKKLRYNCSSKILYVHKDSNNNEKTFTKEANGNTDNYKIIDIKQQTYRNNNNKIETLNNTAMRTVVYTNKKNNNTKGAQEKRRNIPQEINLYFSQRGIKYTDRGKYTNAALLIQTSYRNVKKNGKIKINFIKKYVKLFRAINNLELLFENKSRYWNFFKDKLILFAKFNNGYIKKKVSKPIVPAMKSTNRITRLNKREMNKKNVDGPQDEVLIQYATEDKKMLRSQSRDVINVEKLLKEKEDLEKRLNDIIKENSMLKQMNLNNKELLIKNLALNEKLEKNQKKTKELEIENKKYLNEFSKTKDKYSKKEEEIADVNMKLKITYLKFILEKKEIKIKNIMKKHLKKFKEISQKIKYLEELQNQKQLRVQDNINKQKNMEKQKEEELMKKKRNKILIEILYNREKERMRFIHSCFSKFYYKGLINQYKFRKSMMLGQFQTGSKKNENSDIKRKEEEERKRKEEEERKRKEEEEKKRKEEEEKKRKEEEEKKDKEDESKKEQTRKMNKLNMERRKKLKKLLQDEKKLKLDIKREYFKKYHFRVFFFASHSVLNKNSDDNCSQNNNDEKQNEENEIKRKEDEVKLKNEREEFIKKRQQKLAAIFFKKDRKNIIKKKNIMERWNLTAKLISLGPKKKLRGRSKKRGDSKKGKTGVEEKTKKPKKSKKNLNLIPMGNRADSEDEKEENNNEKDKDKEDENL
jgi:hypothetical protein